MAEKSTFPFGAFMPGLDFLNQLASAGSGRTAAPGLHHWIAPTVDTEELERRIEELRTVQFWLEQNLLGIQASIQALEVQKMTLQTLEGMNVSMGEVAKAFTLQSSTPADAKPAAGAAPRPKEEPAQEPARDAGKAQPQAQAQEQEKKKDQPAAGMADPLLWWGALSQQFQQIAAQALQDATRPAAAPASDSGNKPPSSAKSSQAAPKPAKKAARKKAAAPKAAPKAARKDSASAPAARKSAPKPKKK